MASLLPRQIAAWLKERRERRIEEAYRAGYGATPQKDHVGEAGFEALRESDRPERQA